MCRQCFLNSLTDVNVENNGKTIVVKPCKSSMKLICNYQLSISDTLLDFKNCKLTIFT